MSRWVLKWEGALDFDDRKAMSRHGAIRCRVPLDPVHFTGLDGRTYFDPMNHIYARVIWLVCDAKSLNGFRNDESCGDLCEAWLGLRYAREHQSDTVSTQMCSLASWIEEAAYLVYMLFNRAHYLTHLDPLSWALRLRDQL